MSRARSDHGFTLIEVMIAMVLSLVILGATLATWNAFLNNDARARKADESLDIARKAVDRVANQMRNLANPTAAGSWIDLAGTYDLVFLTSDPVKRRVRYCLASSPGGANDTLWFQSASSSAALTAGMTAGCPSSGWTTQQVVAEHVVNRIGGAGRGVFRYGCSTRTPVGQSCTSSSALYPRVLSTRVELFVDVNSAARTPAEARLSSGVYLRNQNEPPTAAIAPPATIAPRTVRLNGAASDDPEGRTLTYQWFKGTGTLPTPTCATPAGPAEQGTIGEGVTLSYRFAPEDTGTQQIRLRVIDAGCLTAVAGPIAVSIP
jgi:prepilin-type N-terminal cleavage/methylation domain-containing protein